MIFPSTIQFQGTWRKYQQRILDRIDEYQKDHHLHIVAAPGSGKTTLGLELILRQQKACLVLVPTCTIRNQWKDRFIELFLTNENPEDWISISLKSCRPITAITYQALFSAVKRKQNAEEAEEDYSELDWEEVLQKANIQCFCLDEAHHLKNEWVLALKEVMAKIHPEMTIALTATPPLDSSDLEWNRYREICGEIDEEIQIPELVKDHNLCPHQDYLILSQPTESEKEQLQQHATQAKRWMNQLMQDEEWKNEILNHPGLMNPDEEGELFLENPDYLIALLSFCKQEKHPYSALLNEWCEEKWIPSFDLKTMEILLQGYLFTEKKRFESSSIYQRVLQEGRKEDCINRSSVQLRRQEELDSMLMNSSGKLKSIHAICRVEVKICRENLRMLILCDSIRREDLRLAKENRLPEKLGAVSVFEYLRQTLNETSKLAVLSGSCIIIPLAAQAALRTLNPDGDYHVDLIDKDYGELRPTNPSLKEEVQLLTQLFASGEIEILIGTRALLGEGWDAPWINSLILASTVGSYVSSNQMRGRAIRIDPHQPDKTANIWHLATMDMETYQSGIYTSSKDFEQLQQRFDAFMGLHFIKDRIESGFERLDVLIPPFSEDKLSVINQMMIRMAMNRTSLRERWNQSLVRYRKIDDVLECTEVNSEAILKPVHFKEASWTGVGSLGLSIATMSGWLTLGGTNLVFPLVAGGLLLLGLRKLRYVYRFRTSKELMLYLSNSLLSTLKKWHYVDVMAQLIQQEEETAVWSSLDRGSLKQKQIYATALSELLKPIENPRYLLVMKVKAHQYHCFAVPECLGRKKEQAESLVDSLNRYHRDYALVYTRTEQGRRILLKARLQSKESGAQVVIGKRKRLKEEQI